MAVVHNCNNRFPNSPIPPPPPPPPLPLPLPYGGAPCRVVTVTFPGVAGCAAGSVGVLRVNPSPTEPAGAGVGAGVDGPGGAVGVGVSTAPLFSSFSCTPFWYGRGPLKNPSRVT